MRSFRNTSEKHIALLKYGRIWMKDELCMCERKPTTQQPVIDTGIPVVVSGCSSLLPWQPSNVAVPVSHAKPSSAQPIDARLN